jgi:hypothetical protein
MVSRGCGSGANGLVVRRFSFWLELFPKGFEKFFAFDTTLFKQTVECSKFDFTV